MDKDLHFPVLGTSSGSGLEEEVMSNSIDVMSAKHVNLESVGIHSIYHNLLLSAGLDLETLQVQHLHCDEYRECLQISSDA